jgi:hypothetical protein
MPDGASQLEPAEAVRLIEDLADRALAGEAGPVVCLDAPEWPVPPPDLIRDLDCRSVYSRPGASRYAAHVQLSREEQLVQRAQRGGAPCLTRETAAQFLGARAEALLRCAFPEQRRSMIRMLRWVQMLSARSSNATRSLWRLGTSVAMS